MKPFDKAADTLMGVGERNPFAAYVAGEIVSITGIPAKTDALGSLSVTVGSGEKRLCVMCALDAPSLAVTFLEENGDVAVHLLGSAETGDRIVTNGVINGILHDGMCDFGFSSRNEAENALAIGDTLYFAENALMLANGSVACVHAGAKACAYAALAAMEQFASHPACGVSVTFSFVSQSALGFRGEAPAAFAASADALVYLAPYDGDMTGILVADKSGAYDEPLSARLENAAKTADHPTKRVVLGDTVGGASFAARAGSTVKTAALLLAVEDCGKLREKVKAESLQAAADTVASFLRGF